MTRSEVVLASLCLVVVLTAPPVAVAMVAPTSWVGSVLGAAAEGMVRPDALARLLTAVAGVLVWLLVLVTIVVEGSAMRRGVLRRRLVVLPRRLDQLVVDLVETSRLGGPASGPVAVAAPLATRLRLVGGVAPESERIGRHHRTSGSEAADAAGGAPPGPNSVLHVVQRGETWWSLAEDRLGDGHRWTELLELNHGVEVDGGVVIGPGVRLRSGWRIRIPLATESTPGSS